MSRIIKTVSLDARSDEIASKKPNFSAWVRNQLLKDDEEFQNSHVTLAVFREKGICNPSAAPRCNICFPHGRPTLPNIKKWNQGLLSNSQLVETVVPLQKMSAANKAAYEKVLQEAVPGLQPKQRKYLRRSLAYIWAFI